MDILAFIQQLADKNIHLWLEAGQLRFSAPQGVFDEELKKQLLDNKSEIIEFLQRQQQQESIIKVDLQKDSQPLSFAQKRFWYLSQLLSDDSSLLISQALLLQGELDIKRLNQSVSAIVNKYDVLHWRYNMDSAMPSQIISRLDDVEIQCFDGCASIDAARADALLKSGQIDLAKQKLFIVLLYHLPNNQSLLFFSAHHIVCDAVSMQMLMRDLVAAYQGLENKESYQLAPSKLRYIDYIYWQNQQAQSGLWQQALDFWHDELQDVQPLNLLLPKSSLKAESTTAMHCEQLEQGLAQQIKQFSQQQKSSLMLTLMASFSSFLHSLSSSECIAFGVPVSGRDHQDLADVFGCFINVLPIKSNKSGLTFIEQIKALSHTWHQAQAQQMLPFEKIVEKLSPKRIPGQNPIFQALFSYEEQPLFEHVVESGTEGLKIQALDLPPANNEYELSLHIQADEGFRLQWLYREDRLSAEQVAKLSAWYIAWLKQVLATPDISMSCLSLSDMHYATNVSDIVYKKSMHRIEDLFEQQVAKTPNEPALLFNDQSLSYQELNHRSEKLAAAILQKQTQLGVQSNIIAVHVHPSLESVIALLAILKSGAAYLPLNTADPIDRKQKILTQAKVSLCISCDEELADVLDVAVLHVSKQTDGFKLQEKRDGDLFNVIFTSGSTGSPKGVMMPHSAIINRLDWMQEYFNLSIGQTVLHKTVLAFDVSVWEIFWPLLNGGKVLIAQAPEYKDPQYIAKLLDVGGCNKVDYCHFVPPALANFLQLNDLPEYSGTAICSGEALDTGLSNHFYQRLPKASLYNCYGPTEAAIDVSCYRCEPEAAVIPIGKAISHTQLYIVDAFSHTELKLVPDGVIGEIAIAGANVADGYLYEPEKTAQVFVDNPFSTFDDASSSRLYLTGDLGFYDAQGNLHFVGRKDRQVKLRGFRIELDELVCQLQQLAAINHAYVELQDEVLIAFYHAQEELDQDDLRKFLAQSLPEYMLPSRFVYIESWPLTAHGKLQHDALPKMLGLPMNSVDIVMAQTPTQEKLLSIWKAVLNVDSIGIYDNFFALGGHSLLAAQTLSLCQDTFDVQIKLSEIIKNPCIASVAKVIDDALVAKKQTPVDGTSEEIII